MDGFQNVEAPVISDLELYTSEDLINELMRRRTFQGIVINNANDFKNTNWTHAKFTVHINSNLSVDEAANVMRKVADNL